VVEGVFMARYMTTPQIWALYFRETKPYKVVQERLRKLKQYGVLRCIEQAFKRGESTPPYLWALDELGKELLVQERGIDPEQIDTTPWMHEDNNHKILHLINTTNVHIALEQAALAVGMTVAAWLDERVLQSQPEVYSLSVAVEDREVTKRFVPDAHFVLSRDGKQGMFWVEIDQATIDLEPSSYAKRSIIGKLRDVLAWEQSAQYQQEFGERPLRYLIVTTGVRRMQNMLKLAEKVFKETGMTLGQEDTLEALGKKILFTTINEVTNHNLLTGPIWRRVGSKDPTALLP
jgi:hypothetical protein